jgi:hypothetical protein
MNDAAMSLNSIIDVNFLLINRIAVLVVTLLFFTVVLLLKRNRGPGDSSACYCAHQAGPVRGAVAGSGDVSCWHTELS